MRSKSALRLPPRHLSSCIFAVIIRDTRGVLLSDTQRFNFFPASPLVAVTYVVEGELRLVSVDSSADAASKAAPSPRNFVAPAQDTPLTSWSPGPVAAVTVGFYPDAWKKLVGETAGSSLSALLAEAFSSMDGDIDTNCARFFAALAPEWQTARAAGGLADWSGSFGLADWARSLMARAALAGPGRSTRALERRLKRWSSQSRRSLKSYADFEELHRLAATETDMAPAALASDAGYADQSHMGRAVRRATGFSPAHLNRLIETEEAFWCYRLLGERF